MLCVGHFFEPGPFFWRGLQEVEYRIILDFSIEGKLEEEIAFKF
jgi:hypothetical protein